MPRQLAALACVAVLAGGCGAGDSNESGAPASRDDPRPAETSPTTPTRRDREGRIGSSYGIIGAVGSEDPRPIAELYAVFSRPGTKAEQDVATDAAHFADPEGSCGAPIPGQARILLRDVGADDADLVAVPTSKGFVAYGLLPMGGGACHLPLKGGMMISGEIGSDTSLHYGLVPDDVESVEVILNGAAHKARMGENGFAVDVESASEKNDWRVVVHRRDGTTQTF